MRELAVTIAALAISGFSPMSNPTNSAQIERIQRGDLVCWHVCTEQAELLVAEQGAQVLSYRRHGEQPLIWLSEQAAYQAGQGVRGGGPICWPWFGDITRNPPGVQAMTQGAVPFHGLARNRDWQLVHIEQEGAGVQLAFELDVADGLPGWPHSASLRLDIELGAQLLLRLTTRNLGEHALHVSQALHSYFAVSDIRQVQVSGLDDCGYIETLEDWQERQQQGDLIFTGETDRIYLDVPHRLALCDSGWQRQIILETRGSRSAVLWNPWIEKSQTLSQFAPDAWQGMLCIESANIWDDCVQLAPGAEQVLQLRLFSEPLLG